MEGLPAFVLVKFPNSEATALQRKQTPSREKKTCQIYLQWRHSKNPVIEATEGVRVEFVGHGESSGRVDRANLLECRGDVSRCHRT